MKKKPTILLLLLFVQFIYSQVNVPSLEQYNSNLSSIGYQAISGNCSVNLTSYNLSLISTGSGARVITIGYNLVQGQTVQISFKHKKKTTTNVPFGLSYGTDLNYATYTNLFTNYFSNATTYNPLAINFTPTVTGVYYFSFFTSISTINSGFDIDDFNVTPCTAKNISISNITSTSANVTWEGNSDSYDISIGSTLYQNITGNTYLIQNLNSCTSYSVGVKSNCTSGSTQNFIYSGTFNTLGSTNSAVNTPYNVDFNTVDTFSTNQLCILGWQKINNGYVTIQTDLYPNGNLIINCAPNATDNNIVISRGINLIGGQNYNISYKYSNTEQNTVPVSLNFSIGTNNDVTSHSVLKSYSPNTANGISYNNAYTTENLNFTPTTTGVYYFGFTAISGLTSGYLHFDDFSVSTNLNTQEFNTVNNYKTYPNPTENVLFIDSLDKQIQKIELFDLQGRLIKTINENKEKYQIDISNFSSATYLIKLSTEKGSQTIKVVKK